MFANHPGRRFYGLIFFTISHVILSSRDVSCLEDEEDITLPPSLGWLTDGYITFRELFQNVIGRSATSPALLKAARLHNKLQKEIPKDVEFPCDLNNTKSQTVPSSVHKLRPGDISVVAALGDSLTAANGAAASNIFHVSMENRGLSWSIGGQGTWRQFLTIPNILKLFNNNLVGYSLGDSLNHHWKAQFNPAEAGAMARDMPFMAKELVKRIQSDSRFDAKTSWKLITLLIGANDFCVDFCYKDTSKTPERHRHALMKTLDVLIENLPRTLVNLVVVPNVADLLPNYKGLPPYCWITQTAECPCIISSRFKHNLNYYSSIIRDCQQVELEVASLPKYQREDFAVVAQPFTLNITFPEYTNEEGYRITDISYLSQDCFHFSQKTYARAANWLWNNMLQPVGNKSTDWKKELDEIMCPLKKTLTFSQITIVI